MTTTVLDRSSEAEGLDLRSLFNSLVESVRSLLAPTEKEITQAGNENVRYVWSLTSPLLLAPTTAQLDKCLGIEATAKTLQELHRRLSRRASKAWVQREEKDAKVRALRPQPVELDRHAAELSDDVTDRWERLSRQMDRVRSRGGFRRPSKADYDQAFARFILAGMCVHIASFSKARFDPPNVDHLWEIATSSLNWIADLHRIPRTELLTQRDARIADRLVSEADAAEAAADLRIAALRAQDDCALDWVEA